MIIGNQLETFIYDVRSKNEFLQLKGIADVTKMIVKMKKDVYAFVYKLLKFTLILPVKTISVERVFSIMNIVKSRLHNRMRDQWINDYLITYIEFDIFDTINNDVIIEQFQNISKRRDSL